MGFSSRWLHNLSYFYSDYRTDFRVIDVAAVVNEWGYKSGSYQDSKSLQAQQMGSR